MGLLSQARTAARLLYSFEAKKHISDLLDEFPADIAHLHNIYHEISPSILHELRRRKVPIVMTLHDYKLVCASRLLMVDRKACKACHGGRYFHAAMARCIWSPEKSMAKNVLGTLEMYLHHGVMDIYDAVNVFIAPSLFLKNEIERMGFKKDLVYLPHFIDADIIENGLDGEVTPEESIVYFGRLSGEKGLLTLFEAAKRIGPGVKVKIIGDGDMRKLLEETARREGISNVIFLGYLKGAALYREIKKSLFAVLPSEAYENLPVSILEAFALGKPVIGPKTGGIPELIKDNETGLTFERGNAEDLGQKITILLENLPLLTRLGENAKRLVKTELGPERHYMRLMGIYENAVCRTGMDAV